MNARTAKTLLACALLSGCAPLTLATGETRAGLDKTAKAPPEPIAAPPAREATRNANRFRMVSAPDGGVESVFLVPTAVDGMVSVGALARSRVYVGALFATQRVGSDRVSGVGLVFKTVGGGLGAALSVSPWITVRVDGEVVVRTMLVERGLYSAQQGPWGPVETLTFRVQPETVEHMAAATEVEVRLGDMATFELGSGHRADLGDFLDQIPAGTRFDRHLEVTAPGGWRSQP